MRVPGSTSANWYWNTFFVAFVKLAAQLDAFDFLSCPQTHWLTRLIAQLLNLLFESLELAVEIALQGLAISEKAATDD